jgi:hypothetical protein
VDEEYASSFNDNDIRKISNALKRVIGGKALE